MTTGSTAAGWYTDAADPRLIRWWDGAAWTEHTQPNPDAAPAPIPAAPPPAAAAPVVAPPPFAASPTVAPPPFAAAPLAAAPLAAAPLAAAPLAAEPEPGPRRRGTSMPISEPVRLVPPTSGSVPVTIPGFDEPLPPPRTGPEPLAVPTCTGPFSAAPTGAPLGGVAPLAVPPGAVVRAPQPASASTPWTSTGTFAQPTGSVDLASVDYEPMTRSWGSGRGSTPQRTVSGVTTAGGWMLALSPVLQLGLVVLGWAITEGGASPLSGVIGAVLGVVALVWIVLATILDYRRLGALGHEFRPSVAWILLGPFFYLMARAIHVYRTTRRGTAPTWVYLALAVTVGAAASLGALALPREASAADLRQVEQRLEQELQAQGIAYSVLCPSQASASLGSSFVCTASDDVGPAALIRVTWTGVGDFSYAFESTVAVTG
ncbi:DUF2510 domain-containing protein [Microcella frigidaquae]|uniref:DUF2510 domain-containing protein n=1 Tax=Microcella frigidaquae TaxID=424758 RepID=A0A840XKY2_9MICO|nr:DUF2510 domain-containing protein [Microcella frigidaquae]MBB5618946.1 hypothetical protein [Microcella frigidaquae]NHN44900.1 DUF2510 domain-containing protein [Microcella frigidaquae]